MRLDDGVGSLSHTPLLTQPLLFPPPPFLPLLCADANVLARSLNQAIKEPQTHLAVFIMNRDGQARLDFIQNMEYKFVELLSVSFARSPDDLIRASISFRYNAVKSKLAIVSARLEEVTNVVKIKNPSLLLQLQQSRTVTMASAAAASAGGAGLRASTLPAAGPASRG
jgi:hypothetical protein